MEIPKFVPNPLGIGLPIDRSEYGWKPGQSGNPGGQWAEKPFVRALREVLKQENNKESLKQIAQKLIDLAIQGEGWAMQMLSDRLDGKAPQEIKLTRNAREMSLDEILGELAESRAAAGIAAEETGAGESAGVH